MNHLGGLIPDHLSGFEDDLMEMVVMVVDLERPRAVHLLLDVQDGGYHMSPRNLEIKLLGTFILTLVYLRWSR